MKETGLLMKAEMVLATLKDRKKQTRRPVTFHNSTTGGMVKRKDWHKLRWDKAWLDVNGPSPAGNPGPYWHVPIGDIVVRVYPRVQPGDILWVRETHYRYGRWYKSACGRSGKRRWRFQADTTEVRYFNPGNVLTIKSETLGWYKRPSIHMPRWANRLDLDVLKVRSEPVQEIKPYDCLAEGIISAGSGLYTPPNYQCYGTEREAFWSLWDFINAERGFPWKDNHPVWIYDFKRIDD